MKGKSAAGRLLVLKRLLFFAVFALAGVPACFGQKYTFSQYGISEGLIQSQVNTLAQDKDHSLWIGTYAGVSHFDGKEFTSYTRANGLPNDFIYTIFTDRNNVKWMGTESGIATIAGNKIFVYKTPPHTRRAAVTSIVQDNEGTIWFLMGNQLYKISNQKIVRVGITDPAMELLSCLVTDKKGHLYTWIYRRGFYSLNGSKWSQIIPFTDASVVIRVVIFEDDAREFYLMSDKGVYRANGNGIIPYNDKLIQTIHSQLLTMERDADGSLWLGTTVGAYSIKNDKLLHFGAANGFINKAVSEIFCDADRNLWFATQGNGLYRHEGDSFVIFDKSQGLSDDFSLFGITKNEAGDVFLGLDGGGLVRFDGKNFSVIPMPADKPLLRRIQCLYADKKGTLFIGTEINGVWRYDKSGFKIIQKTEHLSIDEICSDADGNTWIATPYGCFYADKDYKLNRVEGASAFAFSLLPVGKDSVFIGTHDGLALAVNKKIVKNFRLDAVKDLAVICLIKYGDNLILGTDDNGVYIWNMVTGNVKNFNAGTGLNSNAIYSLAADEHGTIWLGTGRGANKLQFDRQRKQFQDKQRQKFPGARF